VARADSGPRPDSRSTLTSALRRKSTQSTRKSTLSPLALRPSTGAVTSEVSNASATAADHAHAGAGAELQKLKLLRNKSSTPTGAPTNRRKLTSLSLTTRPSTQLLSALLENTGADTSATTCASADANNSAHAGDGAELEASTSRPCSHSTHTAARKRPTSRSNSAKPSRNSPSSTLTTRNLSVC